MPESNSAGRLGPGDAAYVLAWCAWREGAGLSPTEDVPLDDRRRFTRWWEEVGAPQLEQSGYRPLDTGDLPPEHEAETERLRQIIHGLERVALHNNKFPPRARA